MGEIDLAQHREFTIAIALGDGHHAALSGMMQALATPFEMHRDAVHRAVAARGRRRRGWRRMSTDAGRLSRVSHNVILTHEDKTYSGAFIASASIPWGASKGDDDLGGYHLVWTRDMVQSATALLACGRSETALARAGLPGLHAASGRQLCAELLDRRDALLDGHPARRGGVPDHAGVAAVEGRRAGELRRLPLCRDGCGIPGPVCADHAAGALGGERRLLAVDAGGGDLRAGVRGGPGAGARVAGARGVPGVLRRLDRGASG